MFLGNSQQVDNSKHSNIMYLEYLKRFIVERLRDLKINYPEIYNILTTEQTKNFLDGI
jgi:hypothetical protein